MHRIEGMIERHQNGELIPAKFKVTADERAPIKKSDYALFTRLYWKAVNERRSISSVAIEAEITANNLYRWARQEGLSINTKELGEKL